MNARSIGIEIVNPGHEFGYVPFADEQIAALLELARGILSRHPIPPHRVVGHSDVAPARKTDPGELFPWKRLAEEGIGLWPAPSVGIVDTAPGGESPDALARFGYGIPPDVDTPLSVVISAFQRHFRPTRFDGEWDAECAQLLDRLLANC